MTGGEWAVLQRGAATLPSAYDLFKSGALNAAAYGSAVAAAARDLAGAAVADGLGLSPAAVDAVFACTAAAAAAEPSAYPLRNVAAAVLLQRRAAPQAGAGAWVGGRRRSTEAF